MREDHYVLFKRDNGFWYYYVYRNGKKVKKSTGEKRKAYALEVVHDRLMAGNLLNDKKQKESTRFCAFAERFWKFDTCPIIKDRLVRGGHYSRQLAETNYNNTRKYLVPAFGNKELEEITPAMVNRWLLGVPELHSVTPQTANKQLSVLRQMLDVAVAERLIKNNPCEKVKPLVPKVEQRGCFTQEEISRLFSSPWTDLYVELACTLAALTGMREGEVRGLRRAQIKEDHIEISKAWADKEGLKSTKSGKSRIVPISPELRARLLSVPNNGPFVFSYTGEAPIYKGTIQDKLKAHMARCGIDYRTEKLSFHSFRHFFNTRLLAAGVDGLKIRAVIGHESERMTEHYAHLSADDMRQIRFVQAQIAQ